MKKGELTLKLFVSTFTLSAFTFGGGYVIVPLMRKKFVERYHWIEEREMLDLVAIAQSSPGAIAVNASILVGYRMAGVWGALITVFGTVLPPLILLSILSYFYTAFRDSAIVQAVLRGMNAGVAAVIADVSVTMCGDILKEKKISGTLLMVAAFASVFFFGVDVKIILIACGLIGLWTAYRHHKSKEGDAP